MSETVLASIVAAAAALIASALGFLHQRWTTKNLIEAEDRRLKMRMQTDREDLRRRELRALLAEVIRRTEPTRMEVEGLANVIMQAQLLLDVRHRPEKELNGQLNLIGQLAEGLRGPTTESELLRAHSELLEKSRRALGLTRLDRVAR